jgi:hypothetical protein
MIAISADGARSVAKEVARAEGCIEAATRDQASLYADDFPERRRPT